MFVRIRHGNDAELLVNSQCAVVNLTTYLRRTVNVVVNDVVLTDVDEAIDLDDRRLELTTEDGRIQLLDECAPFDIARGHLLSDSSSVLNRFEEPGAIFVLVEKRILSASTPEAHLHAIKRVLEVDGRRLYEKSANGIVSPLRSTAKSRRSSAAVSPATSSSPVHPPKGVPVTRPSSNSMKPMDSTGSGALGVTERFYYVPLLNNVQSALPDYFIHRPDEKYSGALKTRMSRGHLPKSSGNGRVTPSPRSRRRSSGINTDQPRRISKSPLNTSNT